MDYALARVDRIIQDTYAEQYEDRIFFLRQDLVIFDEDISEDDFEFITDMDSFLYPTDKKELTEIIVFKKGDKIKIEEVDFDVKKIEIDFQSVDENREGTLIFMFNDRLSTDFAESRYFTRRFEEIFMQESLKKSPLFSDRISKSIEQGDIQRGMSRDELLLTLGKPFDIVTYISETERESWLYREETRHYWFHFEDEALESWVAY